MAKSYDHLFKILLIGDSGVDKTQILFAFTEGEYTSKFVSTIGIDFRIKHIELAGKRIKLQIWDTAGQDRFRTVTTAYYRAATGIMLVYDITNDRSFRHIEDWLRQVKEYAEARTQIILIGNKLDLNSKRQVREEEGKKLASANGIKFIEVSSKERINIDKAFITLTEDMLNVAEKRAYEPFQYGKLPTESKAQKDSESAKETSILRRLLQPFFGGKTQAATSVPDEIKQDPYALDLYEKALRDGTETDRSIRINIVGNYRQGKTSLMRRLLGKKVTDVSSTDGIDVIHYKCCRTVDGKFSFRTAEVNDKSDIVERLVSVALSSNSEQLKDEPSITQSVIYQREPKLETVTARTNTDYSEMAEINKGEKVLPIPDRQMKGMRSSPYIDVASSSDFEDNENIVKKSKKTILSVKEKEFQTFSREFNKRKLQSSTKATQTLFDIWDFGGQHIFYATHTLFHSKNAIYLLVFDLSVDLKSVSVDEDFPKESDDQDLEYFLHFWMNSIHSFVGSEDGFKPTVILVGTHKDKVKGNAKDKRQYIEQYFNQIRTSFDGTKLLNHIHSEDFAVDNSIGNDETVSALRATVVRLGNAQSKAIKIPAKWIQLEKALTDRKHIKIIPFELVLAIDEQTEVPIGDPEQIKLFLRYHHGKGTFTYFDEEPLSEHVVLDPQYLIDAFKCIITSERFCTNNPEIRPLWKMLQTDGRLEVALIDKQWGKDGNKMFMEHKEVLILFLTKHHIISEATRFDDTTQQSTRLGWFVVPSLLKVHLPQVEIQQFLKGRKQTIVRFVMSFGNSTIVPTIYHRLMAALIGKWPIAQLGTKPLISKDKCIVLLNMDHAGVAELGFDTIELTVVSLCHSSAVHPEQADVLRRFAEALILHEFSKLERKHDSHSKPYKTTYRCNHEMHNGSGSIKVLEIDNPVNKNLIPCPDLIAHDVDVIKARDEWFQDHSEKISVSKVELNDKVLSKISRCIGNNWQMLGLELGLTQVDIEQISEDNPHKTAMKIYYMLKCWCRQNAELADMNVLVQKMQECPYVSIQWDAIRNIVDEMKYSTASSRSCVVIPPLSPPNKISKILLTLPESLATLYVILAIVVIAIAIDKDPSFLIVGNKSDAESRTISRERAEQYAADIGAGFIEVSAKTSVGIDEAFCMIAKNIKSKIDRKKVEEENENKALASRGAWNMFDWMYTNPVDIPEVKKENKAIAWTSTGKMFNWIYPYFGWNTPKSANRVPEELKQDPYTLELYRLALLEGKELDRSIRVNIVGNYGQGKTTLMRRILKKSIENVESTNAIDVEHYICQRTLEGKLSYNNSDDLDFSGTMKRLVAVARSTKEYFKDKLSFLEAMEQNSCSGDENDEKTNENVPETEEAFEISGEHEKQSDTISGSKTSRSSTDDGCHEGISANMLEKRSILSEEGKMRFALELSQENSTESNGDMDTSIEFWDFGGQFIFYATHTMFHSRKAIYLLVLDLTSNLNEIAVDQDFPTESHERSMEYFVRFWLNSIHSFVGSENGFEPTVILVGTHKDKLKGDVSRKVETFFENIRSLFDGTKLLNHLYREDFAVDNTSENDEGVSELREAIYYIGNEKAKTEEIPAQWIQLEKSLKEKVRLKIISFQFVMEIDASNEYPLRSAEQVKLFLQYHHAKGTFIYFDEEPISSHVVLDPQYLIDAFKCIITSARFCKNDPEIRPLFTKLQVEGRLEMPLIDRQWSKNPESMYTEHKKILLAFLTKHYIISEATEYDEDTKCATGLGWYVVPSLLRDQAPEEEFETFLAGKMQTKLRFVLELSNSTIVPTVYHKLIAGTIGKWPVVHFRDKPLMYKNVCVVRLNEHHVGISDMRTETIELTVAIFCSLEYIESEQCDRFRRFAESVIKHEFRKLKSEKEVNTIPYVTTFRCNQESHGLWGSKAIIKLEQTETSKRVPCPDLGPHAITTKEAMSEWYTDNRLPIEIPKASLSEKILSKVSQHVGHNWQTLGHELGITQVQIEHVIEENPNSTSRRIYAMLFKWFKQEADLATLDVLIGAMQRCPTVSVDWDKIRNIIDDLH
ncbi:uncharacterized protein LOC123535278 [Mercenaria mercenaria]|uniref:uncharacterized protein LOC123535278 n=1 Tax=Mercenaria mercenaria TaxID=6596 RepID=UPI00234F31A8|nr:uncharacterized protein LOC123535278 [Mercenaria mercenaria]